jgi:DNA-binding transcriptional regulator YbjK
VAITAKGEARRELLLEATLRILERQGPGGVTHRAVATEAGVPLAAATYYFATLDDLYISALRRATLDDVAAFSQPDGATVAGFARALFDWTHGGRARAIASYELVFLAMRRENLREDADLWYSSLDAAIAPFGLPAARADLAALAIDGLLLRMLWRGEPDTLAGVTEAVEAILAI